MNNDGEIRQGRQGMIQTRGRMADLATSFPTLRGLPGIAPWDPEELDRAASVRGGACEQAAGLVLEVWNSQVRWKCRFSLGRALRTWDAEHLAAFQAFVKEPFIP